MFWVNNWSNATHMIHSESGFYIVQTEEKNNKILDQRTRRSRGRWVTEWKKEKKSTVLDHLLMVAFQAVQYILIQ